MKQIVFGMASDLKKKTQGNIKEIFNNTARANFAGKAVAGSKGSLMNSVALIMGERHADVEVGGLGVPYARIHEFGGIIRPRRTKYLTIPAEPRWVGKRAKEFGGLLDYELVEDEDGKFRPALVLAADLPVKGKRKVIKRDSVVFWLVKRVQMPARPYLKPAFDLIMTQKYMAEKSREVFGSNRLWKIEET
jgi:phage gpG-like protein